MAESTFFFYDLETSGTDCRRDRIMQFAGQRTDMELNPIGEPLNILVKLSEEVLPSPIATMITGITPQFVNERGITEREATKRFMEEAFTPGTIAVGFNNVRFDDEFIRFTAYRNFYDAYEWCWSEGRSRWDLLDVVRLIRALRPEGVVWPFDEEGKPTNKLEMLARANNLPIARAHDALSDVLSLIGVAQLLRAKQPKIFDYLLKCRSKNEVSQLIDPSLRQPFVYGSGSFGTDANFVTVAVALGKAEHGKVVVYDLRKDPAPFIGMATEDLRALYETPWEERRAEGFVALPAKMLAPNRCPAVAPYSTLRDEDAQRIGLDKAVIADNLRALLASDLPARLLEVFSSGLGFPPSGDVDGALYDSFMENSDKRLLLQVRNASAEALATLNPHFSDSRLPEVLLRYKARNVPSSLSPAERAEWDAYVSERRAKELPKFIEDLEALQPASEEQGEWIGALRAWARL